MKKNNYVRTVHRVLYTLYRKEGNRQVWYNPNTGSYYIFNGYKKRFILLRPDECPEAIKGKVLTEDLVVKSINVQS